MPLHIVLIGPPGAGKSTLAPALMARFDLARIATGERLRAEVAARSAIGRVAAGYIERGALVPDGLIDRLLRASIDEVPADRGLLLDGYPRNLHQATVLDTVLRDTARPLSAVVVLDLPDTEILRRLGGRRLCTGAGDPWVLHVDDAAAVRRCRDAGGRLVQRDDDRPDVIRRRLEVYRRETAPVLAHYAAGAVVRPVDAATDTAGVCARAIAAVTAGQ